MKTKLLTLVALVLAFPTYGISLIIWVAIKYYYDKVCATRILINAAVISVASHGHNEIRYGINNAALPMLFDAFEGRILMDLGHMVSGILPHPTTGEMIHVTMSQISQNRLVIKATRC